MTIRVFSQDTRWGDILPLNKLDNGIIARQQSVGNQLPSVGQKSKFFCGKFTFQEFGTKFRHPTCNDLISLINTCPEYGCLLSTTSTPRPQRPQRPRSCNPIPTTLSTTLRFDY